MSLLYPVAASVEEALSRPRARAAREREAAVAAAGEVGFVTELAGPAFATRDAALDAYAGRLDDDRDGRRVTVPPEDRWCQLVEVAAATPAPVQPVFAEGRRWPEPASRPATVWRLSVSYWRIGGAVGRAALDQARAMRRNAEAAALPAQTLRALSLQPLQPVRPQQPLDIGLFETRPPEAPHIIMPDE
jgi:hypothetical protein